MAIAVVAYAWGAAGATSPAIDSTGSNLLLTQLALSAAAYTSTTDNKSNPYTNLSRYGGTSPYHTYQTHCDEADIVAVGSGHTANNALGYHRMGFIAVSGAASVPFDQESGTDATSATSIQPGSLTPSEDGCLLVSTVMGATGITPPAGWTVVGSEDGSGAVAYLIQGTAAAVNPTWGSSTAVHLASSLTVWKSDGLGGGGGGLAMPPRRAFPMSILNH